MKETSIWNRVTDAGTDIMKKNLGYKPKNKKQKWMTKEILLLMDERRKHKNDLDGSMYKTIHRQIKTKIRT